MAKGSIEVSGLDEIIDELNKISADIDPTLSKSLTSELKKIESDIKINVSTMLGGEHSEGVLRESVSSTVSITNGAIIGGVGVYDMGQKTNSMDRTVGKTYGGERRITAPMVALFYESGIRPHSTKALHRLEHPSGKKRVGNDDPSKMHRGSPPRPIITQAFNANINDLFSNLTLNLDKLLDKK